MNTRHIRDLKIAILLVAMALGLVLQSQTGEGATADCAPCAESARVAS